jgi:hypothetical protein
MKRLPTVILDLVVSYLGCADVCALQAVAREYRKRFLIVKKVNHAVRRMGNFGIVCRATVPALGPPSLSRLVGSDMTLDLTRQHCLRTMDIHCCAEYLLGTPGFWLLDTRFQGHRIVEFFGPPEIKAPRANIRWTSAPHALARAAEYDLLMDLTRNWLKQNRL